MWHNKTKLIFSVILMLFIVFFSGCNLSNRYGNHVYKSEKDVKLSSINYHEIDFHSVFKGTDITKDLGYISAFGDDVVFSIGSGELPEGKLTGLTYLNNLIVYNLATNSVECVCTPDKNFLQIVGSLDNDWIVYKELENENGLPEKIYEVEKNTGKKRLLYNSVNETSLEGEDSFFHLADNTLFLVILKFYKNKSKIEIYKVDLKTLNKVKLFTKESDSVTFNMLNESLNKSYAVFNCSKKMNSSVCAYYFDKKVFKKFFEVDKNMSRIQLPVVTPDDFVILEKYTSLGNVNNYVVAIQLLNSENRKTYKVDMVNIKASNDYVVGQSLHGVIVIDRHTDKIYNIIEDRGDEIYELGLFKDLLFLAFVDKNGKKHLVYVDLRESLGSP